jgi:hypothetical protein
VDQLENPQKLLSKKEGDEKSSPNFKQTLNTYEHFYNI